MTEKRFLSQMTIRPEVTLRALGDVMQTAWENGVTPGPGHEVVWTAFAKPTGAPRDFLWREVEPKKFLVLSARNPKDYMRVLRIDPPKTFAPKLTRGDAIRFSLRVNPVRRKVREQDEKTIKIGIVIDAIRQLNRDLEPGEHREIVEMAGKEWIGTQGENHGFRPHLPSLAVNGYETHKVSRRDGQAPMTFATMDFEGMLEVIEPEAFLMQIDKGFGAAKAFGCGLMLIRRMG